MSRVLTRANFMLLMSFASILTIVFLLARATDMPEDARTLLATLAGMFARDVSKVFDYEFGSSRGSADKSETIARMSEEKK